MARKKQQRNSKKVYAIIVDGQTEVWYLQLLKKHEALPSIDVKPELPKRKKLEAQYNTVIENIEAGYDKVFWLLDMDTILNEEKEVKKGEPSRLEQFKQWKVTLEKNEHVYVLVNMPCLEYWHLLHFLDTGKSFEQCKSVEKELSKYLEDYEKSEKYYKKASEDIYQKLRPQQFLAKERAKRLGRFDFEDPSAAKAEIWCILELLGLE